MPPRTPEEIADRRINNLIGVFAVSVFFFFITWLAGRQSAQGVSMPLLWFFGLLGGASLVGWWVMAAARLGRPRS